MTRTPGVVRRAAGAVGIAFAALAAGAVWYALAHGPVEVEIPRERAQETIDKLLPFVHEGLASYTVDRAAVDLRADGRVGLDFAVRGRVARLSANGTMSGSARIDYRDGSFYLADVVVDRGALEPRDPPGQGEGANGQGGGRTPLAGLIAKGAAKLGVSDEDARRLREAVSEDVRRLKDSVAGEAKGLIAKAANAALAKRPIYTLDPLKAKTLKGAAGVAAARLALVRVEVRDGVAVAVLDPATGLGRLAWWAAAGVCALLAAVGIAVAVARNPLALAGLLTFGLLA